MKPFRTTAQPLPVGSDVGREAPANSRRDNVLRKTGREPLAALRANRRRRRLTEIAGPKPILNWQHDFSDSNAVRRETASR